MSEREWIIALICFVGGVVTGMSLMFSMLSAPEDPMLDGREDWDE
jgi:hypothetical protein